MAKTLQINTPAVKINNRQIQLDALQLIPEAMARQYTAIPLTIDGNALRVVMANPVMMAIWGLIIVAAMTLGALPALVGLAVVIPILGHASWHLYKKAVV